MVLVAVDGSYFQPGVLPRPVVLWNFVRGLGNVHE